MARWVRTSFNAGKLSSFLDGRVDIAKYYNGCSVLINSIPMPEGGVFKRPGTIFVAKALGASRLIPFEFSANDTVVLEFSDRKIRFFSNGDRVLTDSLKISSISLPSGQPVVVETLSPHGYSTGDTVRFHSVSGTIELNYIGSPLREWTIAVIEDDEENSSGSTRFSLNGTDGDDFTAYDSGGYVQKIYELNSPYEEDDLFRLCYIQSADVIYITHRDYPPKVLSRKSATEWTLEDFNYKNGPFLADNTDESITVQFSPSADASGQPAVASGYYFPEGTTGTLTSTGDIFNKNHVGSIWLIRNVRLDNVLTTPDNNTNSMPTGEGIRIKGRFTFEVLVSSNSFKLWRRIQSGVWQEVRTFSANTAYTSEETEENVYYTFTRSSTGGSATLTAKNQICNGIVRITDFTDPRTVSVKVVSPVHAATSGGTDGIATSMWAEGAWNNYRGWPSLVNIFEGRLWFAATAYNPQTLWASRSGDYDDFQEGIADDDAIVLEIEDSDLSEIVWMAPDEELIIGTMSKEYRITSGSSDDPITPSNMQARLQSSYGSYPIQPVRCQNSILFFQRGGRIARLMRFNEASYRYESENASILSRELFESLPVQMVYQRSPFSIVWIVRSDGALVSLTYDPREEVVAWAEHITGGYSVYPESGKFISVAVVQENGADVLYLTVRRTIGTETVYYIERMILQIPNTNQPYTDSSLVYSVQQEEKKRVVWASDTVLYGSGTYGTYQYGVIY